MSKATYSARFANGQSVKVPLGNGKYQEFQFIGTDCHGFSTVKTIGGRFKIIDDRLIISKEIK